MTARLAQAPLYVIDCDRCGTTFEPQGKFNRSHENPARGEARDQGWTVRPNRGKGSRSAPDLCPACSTD